MCIRDSGRTDLKVEIEIICKQSKQKKKFRTAVRRISISFSLEDCKFSVEKILRPAAWALTGAHALRLEPHQPHG